ncbi:MAG: MFS transporter [Elainella sp. Prado103]|jgi:hypothetical protein|nr:MFS transporter [Elainella sp. Prado103]
MRIFTIIWCGQLVSTIGSYMTEFVLTLWVWEVTHSVAALTSIGLFGQISRVIITPFAGVIVDRYPRQPLICLSDAVAALSTAIILVLYVTAHLETWHLYILNAINSGFGQIQALAYSTSVTLMVPASQYTRTSSMESAIHYGSAILAPALAGSLYTTIGLTGILWIDIATFGVAITTLFSVKFPVFYQSDLTASIQWRSILHLTWQQTIGGLHYCWMQPGLRGLLLITLLFWFAHDLGEAIYDPMILARSNGNAQILASTSIAAGIGGVIGAIGLSAWGGFQQRTRGLLWGMIGAGLSKTCFGLGQAPAIWLPAQFSSSLHFPLLSSSETALWMQQVAPERQGRVFAANSLLLQIVSAGAIGCAGWLADRFFEPAMLSNRPAIQVLQPIFGTGAGAGTAILYVCCAISMCAVGILGCWLPLLQQLEDGSIP